MANSIKQWAEDDRPREKLLAKGSNALSNAELLAIIINNGTTNESALELAQKILASLDNRIDRLAKMSVKQILNLKIKGIGPAKAIAIAAALELGLRRETDFKKPEKLNNIVAAASYLQAKMRHLSHEVFIVMYLDTGGHLLHEEIMSQGGLSGTVVDERIIIKRALEYNAVQILLSHNHPGGTLRPSRADEIVTEKVRKAAELFNIKILDHIIATADSYFSFVEEGLL